MHRLPLRAALAVLLVLSLAIKVHGDAGEGTEARTPLPASLLAYLEDQGFSIFREDGEANPWVTAQQGECRLELAEVSPKGWHDSMVAEWAGSHQLAYTYEGQVYSEQPVLQTRLGYYLHRLKRYLLLPSSAPAVRAVIVSPECPGGAVDLAKIAALGRW